MNSASVPTSNRLPDLLRRVADKLRAEEYPYPDLRRFAAIQRVSREAGLTEIEGAALVRAVQGAQREAEVLELIRAAEALEQPVEALTERPPR